MLARIEGSLKLGLEIIRSFWARSPRVPKGTLVGLPEQRGSLFWTVAGRRGKPAMMVVGNFQFTNVQSKTTNLGRFEGEHRKAASSIFRFASVRH